MKRPRVAVTHDKTYRVDAYLEAVESAGGEAVPVLPGDHASMDEFDALLLSGGVDINPAIYGEPIGPRTETPDLERDRLEQQMLAQAIAAGKPILAVCRGMQLFNAAHGGTLEQHTEGHVQGDRTAKERAAHEVQVSPGSQLAELVGAGELPVNSRHHQTVARLGKGLTVSASAGDGIIEALERRDLPFAIAVQWHPEDMAASDAAQRRLFEGLIAAARAAEN